MRPITTSANKSSAEGPLKFSESIKSELEAYRMLSKRPVSSGASRNMDY